MAYAFVDFKGPAAKFKTVIEDAKNKGVYAGQEMRFDQAVIKSLSDNVTKSLEYTQDFAKKVTEHHASAKKAIDGMEALIKKKGKKLSDDDIKVLETSARFCQTVATQLADTSAELYKANKDFRETWSTNYKALLSERSKPMVDDLVKMRLKSIDDGKKIDALKNRVDEYAVRSKEFVKAAVQSASKEAVLAGGEANALEAFKQETAKLKFEYEKLAQKARNSLQQICDLNAKKKPTADEWQTYDSRISNGEAEAKNARGQLKTFKIKVDTYKKLVSKLDGPNKKTAETVLKNAEGQLKVIEKDSAELDKLESKAEKMISTLKKLK